MCVRTHDAKGWINSVDKKHQKNFTARHNGYVLCIAHRCYMLLRNMDWYREQVTWSQHSGARGEISNDKSIAGLHPEIIVIFSRYSAYPLGRLYTYCKIRENECEKQKVYSWVFHMTFFAFRAPFFAFCISQHFAPGLAFARTLKGFRGSFFRGINKTRSRICENIRKMQNTKSV